MNTTTNPRLSNANANRPLPLLVGASVAWGIVLLVLAAAVPIETVQSPPIVAPAPNTGSSASAQPAPAIFTSPRVTLVHHDGSGVLLLVAIPIAISLLVGALLWIRGARQSTAAGVAAWALSAALLAAAVVGFVTFLIGIAVVPIGVLLIIACIRTAPAISNHSTQNVGH